MFVLCAMLRLCCIVVLYLILHAIVVSSLFILRIDYVYIFIRFLAVFSIKRGEQRKPSVKALGFALTT